MVDVGNDGKWQLLYFSDAPKHRFGIPFEQQRDDLSSKRDKRRHNKQQKSKVQQQRAGNDYDPVGQPEVDWELVKIVKCKR